MRRAVVLLFVAIVTSLAAAEKAVTFQDAGLKTAVEAQLHVPNPTPADMLKLFCLVANARGITDLTGLEYAVNLSTLNLGSNSISSLVDRAATRRKRPAHGHRLDPGPL